MKLRFDYTHSIDHLMETWSTINLEGTGEWEFGPDELYDEYVDWGATNITQFLYDLFDFQIDFESFDSILFDKDCIKEIEQYFNEKSIS